VSAPFLVGRSRGVIRVRGRDPVRMINGLATADLGAVTPERGTYAAFLTAKGRMVADARIFRAVPAEPAELLLDVAPSALAPLLGHIGRFVPPLFATAEDETGIWAVIGVYGPGSSDLVGRDAAWTAPEETVIAVEDGGFAVRTRIIADDGWDLFVPATLEGVVTDRLIGRGARPGTPEMLEALRIAAGQPRWGRELTEEVIPLEAGLLDRAISQTKGCYTGQEVIVRILHRGHVNRHLRRLVFEGGAPEHGTPLFAPDEARPRGVVTSSVENEAGALGLGYVRREIDPPAELHVGWPDRPRVRVEALE
jgi:tRNA-modifying protein YgfZ